MAKLWYLVYFVASLNSIEQLSTLPVSDDGGRIVGGEDADITEAPYQLSLGLIGVHNCGASIIAANWAVSAAHCFHGESEQNCTLVAGTSYHTQGGETHSIKKIYTHELFNKDSGNYDIAVIEVNNPFKLGTRGVNCIRLANQPTSVGAMALATGWNMEEEEFLKMPEQLQKVSLPVVSNSDCNESYSKEHIKISKNMICAGYKEGGKDACQGDSGGPLAIDRELIGVASASFGVGCGLPNFYGVYTNVNEVRDWIVNKTGPLEC